MPTPEAVEAPTWAQIGLAITTACTAIGGILNALRPKKDEISSHATVSETVTMANEKPYRDALEHLEAYVRRMADNSDVLVALERRRVEAEEHARIRAEARQEAQEEESRKRVNALLENVDRAERRGEQKPAGR